MTLFIALAARSKRRRDAVTHLETVMRGQLSLLLFVFAAPALGAPEVTSARTSAVVLATLHETFRDPWRIDRFSLLA